VSAAADVAVAAAAENSSAIGVEEEPTSFLRGTAVIAVVYGSQEIDSHSAGDRSFAEWSEFIAAV